MAVKPKYSEIRIHNQGKREFTIPPAKGEKENRKLLPGRALEVEKEIAEKYLAGYPREIIEFDSLVTESKTNLAAENLQLESKNNKQADEIKALKEKLKALENSPEDPPVIPEEPLKEGKEK